MSKSWSFFGTLKCVCNASSVFLCWRSMHSVSSTHTSACPGMSVHICFLAVVAFCSAASVPLPEICMQVRPDRNSSLGIPSNASNCGSQGRVRRVFFHPTLQCKNFGLCPPAAQYLDDNFPDGAINYFQDKTSCFNSCTNGKNVCDCTSVAALQITIHF